MKRFLMVLALVGMFSCKGHVSGDFTADEVALIREACIEGEERSWPEGTMRVLTIEDPMDLAVLRSKSVDLSASSLLSDEYSALCSLMVATVTHPSQDGVGIAGPQVGLNRRVVAVQRFDKEGEPFEVYPNISIVWASDSLTSGGEGCLSVPDRRGEVLRSTEIVIEYDVIRSCGEGCEGCLEGDCADGSRESGRTVETIRETVSGFTAVIFQHEVDHLDGILYIDRL